MKKYVISLLIMTFLFVGCAPSRYEPYEPPKIEFEKTEQYNPDFSSLEKPDKPDFIYLNKDFEKTEDTSTAKYAALDNENLKKILELSKLHDTQVKIIDDQTELVNLHIEQINTLKELVKIKEFQVEQYRALYTTAENQYLQEKYDNKLSNLLKDSTLYLVTVGAVVVAILAL